MSDKPEEQQPAQRHRNTQPSFEEILEGVSLPEAKAPPAPKKSAQPTFEEILAATRPVSEPPQAPEPERKGRSSRQREER